jgi:hypothetical protein
MKKSFQIIAFLLISGNLFSQNFPYMRFRKPTYANNAYTFSHVISGIDAVVTVVGSKNATVSAIDDSTTNAYAWNPNISFGRANGSFDTSYIDFKITFKNHTTGANVTQDNVAVTVVDLDGSLSLREMVAASLPSTPKGILGSTISTLSGLLSNTFVSGIINYSVTDTNNTAAMTQINYTNVNNFTLRMGVIGKTSANTVRNFSFYYKGFNTMTFVLPVKLMNLDAYKAEFQNIVKWSTTSEENCNKFEIFKSNNGQDFFSVGSVAAAGNSQTVQSYNFVDNNVENLNTPTFYKLKMIDNDGSETWSHVIYLANESKNTTVQSIYPNPSANIINVNFETVSEDEFTVEVIDAFGKVYQSTNSSDLNGSSNVSFDISQLNNGIYFIRINSNNACEINRFVKI